MFAQFRPGFLQADLVCRVQSDRYATEIRVRFLGLFLDRAAWLQAAELVMVVLGSLIGVALVRHEAQSRSRSGWWI